MPLSRSGLGSRRSCRFQTQNEMSEAAYTYNFRSCGRPPHHTCVIDGDTFYLRAASSIRIADIDAPETHPPRCSR